MLVYDETFAQLCKAFHDFPPSCVRNGTSLLRIMIIVFESLITKLAKLPSRPDALIHADHVSPPC